MNETIKVCRNCREPLGWYGSKYCKRCAPHVARMLQKERDRKRSKRHANPFFVGMSPVSGCKTCGRIKYKSEFYHPHYHICKACKSEIRKSEYTPAPPRPKKEKPLRYCKCGGNLMKNHQMCKVCKIEGERSRARQRMRTLRANGYVGKSTRSLEAKRRRNKIKRMRRDHRKNNLPFTLTETEWAHTLSLFNGKCVYCGAPWEHKDHFVPMAKGGGFTRDNIVPACASCNSILKNDKLPGEFIGKQKAFEIAHQLGIH